MFISRLHLEKLIVYYDGPRVFTAKFNDIHYIFTEYEESPITRWVVCRLKFGDLYKLSHGRISLQDLYEKRDCFLARKDRSNLMPMMGSIYRYLNDEPVYFHGRFKKIVYVNSIKQVKK